MSIRNFNRPVTSMNPSKSMMNRMTRVGLACLVAFGSSSAWAQTQDTVTTFAYDNLGNIKTISRPLSRTTSYSYDAFGRMTQRNVTVGSATLITKQSFDGLGHVATVTDPRNFVTTYTVDGLGNRSQLSSPDTHGTGYTVDEAGNVLTVTDARDKTTAFQYDALNRLIQAQYQSGVPSKFEYDGGPGGPAIETGNLTRFTDESGSTTITHDMKGRVLTKTQTVSTGGSSAELTLQYSYGSTGSAIGKLETITYPSGARVNYRYDAGGRVTSVTVNPSDGSGGTIASTEVPLLTDVAYTPTGNVQSWRWGNSALPIYQRMYDLDGRLTSYPTDPAGTVRTVTYNAASLATAFTHAGGQSPAQYDQTFTYDTADRLTSFTQGGVTTTYTYDANGNRTQQTGPSVIYTYDTTSNRLSSATFSTPRTYQYDAAGNRIADGLNTYTYSDRGRLAQVSGAAQLSMYYNALGQRVLKAGAAQRIYYVYDEEGHTIGEYGQQYIGTVETVYLGDLPIAVLTPSLILYAFADHIGTPLVLALPYGQIAWDWRNHDPFGNNAPSNSSFLPAYDHRFPGQVADGETGLFYNYFRDYDPQTGRYIQSDPIGLGGGINTYGYVESNPLSNVDQLGLQSDPGGFSTPRPQPLPMPGDVFLPGTGANNAFVASVNHLIKIVKNACKSESSKEECREEAALQLERDQAECLVARAAYGKRGQAICLARAMENYSQRLRECDGK
ncbi:RHS repeat protein [Massilia sp. TW-1]|uniref:RHS repeat protein n=1 Tax=Telluria antibiotica TaxID=2717319 RepID=A0ABX0PBF2_9BURK|nr:RHS repeat protein [Telluria antibiotica]NIA54680.1 RHS repeat protein [Telluria antibiotica]